MKQTAFLDAMNFRHACKIFDDSKKISSEDLNYILECGRKSPSSFGMEQWKFLVVQNQELKEKIKPLCWGQPQISTCSDLVIILAKKDVLKTESGYPKKMFSRRGLPEEKVDAYVDLYTNFMAPTFAESFKLYSWSARQCYLAAANMMTGAAFIGIDSCPIEGFDKEAVEKLLELNSAEFELAMMLPFGYRLNEQSKQERLSFDEVVEFIK